jgi:hypothetical protein
MKHAGAAALEALRELIATIRTFGLTEKSTGVFYRKGKAALHFHEDPAGLFADVRLTESGEWERLRVYEPSERQRLVALLARELSDR